ncbi:hypothetical protein QE152_g38651 [Popillia japonica]|uniref:Uncharacterized protein n=1 Tax=Popillia japonica TaxID=7064 RepID=A0AAW1HW76_POPJA
MLENAASGNISTVITPVDNDLNKCTDLAILPKAVKRTKGSRSEQGMIYQYGITALLAAKLSADDNNFFITAASEIQTRFPLNHTFFDGLKFLNPIAVSIVKPENIKSLACVWEKFGNVKKIDGGQIDTEWNNADNNVKKIDGGQIDTEWNNAQ